MLVPITCQLATAILFFQGPPQTPVPNGCGGLSAGPPPSTHQQPFLQGARSVGLAPERSGGARSSAFSGEGGGSSSRQAFLGSCLKERKRNCRSLHLLAF